MKVEQAYEIANELTKEYLGEEDVLQQDFSNLTDIGSKTINLDNLDKYVRSLIDQIGKFVFVNRPYSGTVPSLFMESWEYGAILEKIQYDKLPEAQQNDSWELLDGVSYDPNIFYKPGVSAKFYSKKVTFDIPMSFAERQVKSAFQSPGQLASFFSMIETAISNSMTVKQDQFAMAALNNMIASTILNNSTGSLRVINLATEFDSSYSGDGSDLIKNPEFIRFAAYRMGLVSRRLERLSTLFNVNGNDRFTPKDRQKLIMLAEFEAAARSYLYSDTYHDSFVKLPDADIIPYWQGSGTDYAFTSTSKINVVGNKDSATTGTVEKSGILAVMFDEYAVAISNLDRRVTSNYNGRAEFYNNWYKFDMGSYIDLGENFVVFVCSN